MTTDVLDAAPPALSPDAGRGSSRARASASKRTADRPGQRARPELPPDRCDRRRLGAEGLERRRGPRRGRDGGGRGRADRCRRPRPAGAGGAPVARRLADRRARRSTARPTSSASCRCCPGRNVAAPRSSTRRRSSDIGEVVARIGVALRGFFHPAAGRTIWWDQQHLPRAGAPRDAVDRAPERRELLGARPRPLRRDASSRRCRALRSQVIHNDVTLDNLLLDDDGAGDRDHRLRRHGAHRAGPRHPGHAPVAGPRAHRPVRGRPRRSWRGTHRSCRSRPARRRCSATCWPGGWRRRSSSRAWRMPSAPRQRVHPRLGGAGVGAARADGGDRLRRGGADGMAAIARAPIRAPRPADDLLTRRRRVLGSALESLSYRRRCTSCAATAPGWRRPMVAATSMPTTTSRSSATPIRASSTPSHGRRRP